jgi:hypothetical protein
MHVVHPLEGADKEQHTDPISIVTTRPGLVLVDTSGLKK